MPILVRATRVREGHVRVMHVFIWNVREIHIWQKCQGKPS
jgi:hypothetical protein